MLQFLKKLKLYKKLDRKTIIHKIASRSSTISIPIKSAYYKNHLQKSFLQKNVTLMVHR